MFRSYYDFGIQGPVEGNLRGHSLRSTEVTAKVPGTTAKEPGTTGIRDYEKKTMTEEVRTVWTPDKNNLKSRQNEYENL